MAERKVLNKYYPPDYDPAKLRRFERKSVRKMCNVRMMLPFSLRCYTCNNYMYIGTKFNMKVEAVDDEDYLGIRIYRFYFKCTQCYGEVTFKTDPKNHDYVAERGASRNQEMWKDMLMAEEEYKEMKQSEMKEDAMKSLEYRTYDSKREMDILDALDQVKTLNRRQAQVNYDELIEKAVKQDGVEQIKLQEEKVKEEAKEKYRKLKEKRIEDYNLDLDQHKVKLAKNVFDIPEPIIGKKTTRPEKFNESHSETEEEEEVKNELKIKPKIKVVKKHIDGSTNKIKNNTKTMKQNSSFALNLLNSYSDN
jgi:hypothetical protein